MSKTIDLQTVRHTAQLARLRLTADEETTLCDELSSILAYVRKLEQLDTTDVAPTSHAVELPTHLRDDQVQQGLGVETSLAAAPERIGDGFGVPKVIE